MIVPKKRVLTIKEAASLIDGLTPFRVRQIVYRSCCATASGQLPCFKAGRQKRCPLTKRKRRAAKKPFSLRKGQKNRNKGQIKTKPKIGQK